MKKIIIITGLIVFICQGLYAQEYGNSYTSPYNRPNGYSSSWGHPKGNPTFSTYGNQNNSEQFKKNAMIYNKLMILMVQYVESEIAKEKGEKISPDKVMSNDAQEYLLGMLNRMDPSDVEILMKKAMQAKDMFLN